MREAPPRLYIDLSDVVLHAIWHDTCGGIARVQFEVATALVRANAQAVPFSLYNATWRDLRALVEDSDGDAVEFYASCRRRFGYIRDKVSWRRPLHLARIVKAHLVDWRDKLLSKTPHVRAEDRLFVGGAYWMNRHVVKLMRRVGVEPGKLIVFFYDFIPITHPHFTGHDFSEEYRRILRLPAHFIVPTPFNEGELRAVRKLLRADARCSSSIVPLADEFPRSRRNERPPLPARLEMLAGHAFVLCVGTIEIRKNHLALMQVWDDLAAEFGERLPKLVIAGRFGWKADEALARLDQLRSAEGHILFIEAPSDDELRWLYSACLFTALPSLFEGWGLPLGEGFWFGKPCAASNAGPLPFAGRDFCVYFSPRDLAQMKGAIKKLLDPYRRGFLERKIEKAPLRTWGEVAADIAKIVPRSPSDGGLGQHIAAASGTREVDRISGAIVPLPVSRIHRGASRSRHGR